MNSNLETRKEALFIMPVLNNEDILDLSKMPVDIIKAKQEIEMIITHLNVNDVSLTDQDKLIYKIGTDAFTELYLQAEALHTGSNNYVTGLKIHFGINSANKVSLFFQPVCCESSNNIPSAKKRVYTLVKSGTLFSYNGVKMIPDADLNDFRGAYSKLIGIKHNAAESIPTVFVKGQDTESLIFSFQEMNEFIRANPAIKDIYIFNSIRTDNSSTSITYKHTLLLSPEIYALVEKDFKGKFANLAHLCPPHCTKLDYDLL